MPGPADYTCDIFTVGGRAGSPLRPAGHASPPKTAASRGAARPQTSLAGPAEAAEGDTAVPITPMHVKVRALLLSRIVVLFIASVRHMNPCRNLKPATLKATGGSRCLL